MKRIILAMLAVIGVTSTLAQAQDAFPSRPIKIIVPFGSGSATDVTARTLGETMKTYVGQQVVAENKLGAFGIISIEEMVRAKSYGYTISLQNVSTAGLCGAGCACSEPGVSFIAGGSAGPDKL